MEVGGGRLRISELLWFAFVLTSCGASQVGVRQDLPFDIDDDGITDADGVCPVAQEDHDGHEDGDGCPDCDVDIKIWCACTGGRVEIPPAFAAPHIAYTERG